LAAGLCGMNFINGFGRKKFSTSSAFFLNPLYPKWYANPVKLRILRDFVFLW
jgi:hypothetical protein